MCIAPDKTFEVMIRIRKGLGVGCVLFIFLCLASTVMSFAQSGVGREKIVKIGWRENCYGWVGKDGKRNEVSFDYQEDLALHLGWHYNYVPGTWPVLLKALVDGDIDMLPFVTKTPEREKVMLFSKEPMGRELYNIFSVRANSGIKPGQPESLAGKRIAVNKGGYQEECLRKWLKEHGIKATVVLIDNDADAEAKYKNGMFDACLAFDPSQWEGMTKVCSIGGSDVYFAFNTRRGDLKNALDKTVRAISEVDTTYDDHIHTNYVDKDFYKVLTDEQVGWLKKHGPVKVGFAKNNLAYSGVDPKTGKLIGGLDTLLDGVEGAFKNATVTFVPVAYNTCADANEALKRGEVDCVFPFFVNHDYAYKCGCKSTAPVLETTAFAISVKKFINESDSNVVALVESEVNKGWFVRAYYPQWKVKYYKTAADCEKAVRKGDADCMLYGAYQAYIAVPSLDLYRIPISRHFMACFGVANDEAELLGILNRAIHVVPLSDVYATMTKYAVTTRKFSMWEFFRTYYKEVLVIGAVIMLCFVVLSLMLFFNSVKLKKAVKVAQHARSVQERFLQNMSHELRTPLNCICGFSQILCMKEMRDAISDEELDEYGKIITSNTEMLTTLVSDILDISDFESGKYKLLLSDTDINEMCRSASYMVSSRLPEGVKFRIDSEVPDGTMLYTDKRRVCQVLTNFLTNAYKHTTKGEVVVGVSATAHPGSITFSVTDTGSGVPAELQDKIFDRFEKGISSLRGIGLGLNICTSIAEALNGQVYLDRDYKTGARFVFVHPCNLKDIALPGANGVSVVRSGEKAKK